MLDFIDPFNLKQKFDWFNFAREVGHGLVIDYHFLNLIRQTFAPLPLIDKQPSVKTDVFPDFKSDPIDFFKDKKIGLVASGGSGALVSLCGVYRAMEEAGIKISAVSVCSGSSIWGTLIAAGLSAEEITEFTLSWQNDDYLDFDWKRIAKAVISGGKNFSGFLKGYAVEKTYLNKLGRMKLSQAPINYYTVVYNMDLGTLEYFGTTLQPDITLAKAVRVSIALPLFVESVEIEGHLYNDGGVIDIFPVEPLLKYEKDIDFFIGVNCICPRNFIAEDRTGWRNKRLAILEASEQLRFANWIEVGRRNFEKVQDKMLLLHPLPYSEIRGVNFYSIFLDRKRWPEIILRSYQSTKRALEQYR